MTHSKPVSTRGFVVGKQPYGDTSLIVRWLTPGEGRMTTMVKGALRPKSQFHRQMDLYYLCDFVFTRARRGEMHTLREVLLDKPFLGLRRSYLTLLTLDYFIALITTLTEADAALPEDFDLFLKAIEHLDAKASSSKLVERFERRLLEIHGLLAEGDSDFLNVMQHHHCKVPPKRIELLRELEGVRKIN